MMMTMLRQLLLVTEVASFIQTHRVWLLLLPPQLLTFFAHPVFYCILLFGTTANMDQSFS
jgi:hypothetical protein